jgi:hypothetical protein
VRAFDTAVSVGFGHGLRRGYHDGHRPEAGLRTMLAIDVSDAPSPFLTTRTLGGESTMTESHLVTVLLALAGGGAGVLLARWVGVVSWLDAKLYIVVGITLGVLIGKLAVRLAQRK